MERSVRYIRVDGMKPALCFRGKKHAYAIINDEPCVRAVEVDLKTHDLAGVVGKGFFPYPHGEFTERMQAVGTRKGITLRALALLAVPEGAEDPETLPPDEIAAPEPAERPSPPPKPPASERRAPKRAERQVTPSPTPKRGVGERGSLIAKLAAELNIAPQQLRLSLRMAGLRAPYDDEVKIRAVIKGKK